VISILTKIINKKLLVCAKSTSKVRFIDTELAANTPNSTLQGFLDLNFYVFHIK